MREKQKNQELEREFVVLRGLIAETQKNSVAHETLLVKSQCEQERTLRIAAEADVARLRQQLADALAGAHRDTLNLKKALSEMQMINQQNLQTIYEKGDQNLAQME